MTNHKNRCLVGERFNNGKWIVHKMLTGFDRPYGRFFFDYYFALIPKLVLIKRNLIMEAAKVNQTLTYLFEKYLEDPNGTWQVENKEANRSMNELGKYLARKGYIREFRETQDGFRCAITMLGIDRVSNEFNHVQFRILEASIEHKKLSVMEILGIEPGHFKRGYDYATFLKRRGIIECIFGTHDIIAKPTFFGHEWYQTNKLNFVN